MVNPELCEAQPDLSGAHFCEGKALAKIAGTEGGKVAIIFNPSLIFVNNILLQSEKIKRDHENNNSHDQ